MLIRNHYLITIALIIIAIFSKYLISSQPITNNYSQTDSLLDEHSVFRKKPTITVLNFTNANAQAKETEFGRTISSMLTTALRNSTNFLVLERKELLRILSEQNLDMTGLTKDKTKELGELYNVEVILGGDVSLINNTLHIDMRLFDIKSSNVAVALYGTCYDLKKIRGVVENLALELEQKYLRQWMGGISIISQPSGAEVYLENIYIGLTNDKKPLIIRDLLEGKYHLKFILGGYYDWEGDITILAKMERSVKVSLIAKPGSMNIYSEPDGAYIFLDNNLVGQTPMSLTKVAEGEHEIRLVKENYKELKRKVTVRSFQPTDVKATLEVSPGMLTINSNPTKAGIYLMGKHVATTPYTLVNLTPGEVVLRVIKDGYEEWTKSLLIKPNHHEVIDINLKEKVGYLSIYSQPEDAAVYIRESNQVEPELVGRTPLLNYTIDIGKYLVIIKKDDHHSASQWTHVIHNKLTDLNFKLQEKPGSIFVETTPSNARIYLDDFYLGRSPLSINQINKGNYEVKMSLPYSEKSKEVIVKPNQRSTIKTEFKKSKKYILGISSFGIAALLFQLIIK